MIIVALLAMTGTALAQARGKKGPAKAAPAKAGKAPAPGKTPAPAKPADNGGEIEMDADDGGEPHPATLLRALEDDEEDRRPGNQQQGQGREAEKPHGCGIRKDHG